MISTRSLTAGKNRALTIGSVGLRRTCACGQHTPSGAECDECKKQKTTLQRNSSGASGPMLAPPMVHDVLRSGGQPLSAATRAFFEPRFERDFSQVRVHTDSRAAESARAVNALAYTVGSEIAFATGQYAPQTSTGARLLAHELAHTVQNPEPATVFRSLEVGAANDPCESAADYAADTVMQGGTASLSGVGGGGVLWRKRDCAADRGGTGSPDQRTVRCNDGSQYRVTLTTSDEPRRAQTTTTVDAGFNNTTIFLTIDVCHGGTDVRITPSVDLGRPLATALGNVLAGSGVLTGVTLKPGVRITIVQNQSFTITVGPSVTVGEQGVTGGGVSGTLETSGVRVTGGVSYDSPTKSLGFTVSVSGGTTQPTVNCTHKGKPRLVFTCELITHTPAQPAVPEQSVTDTEVRYVFFDYKTPNIRRNFRLPADIQGLYEKGYRVSSIEGFTSPEGPRDPGPNFEGNIALAKERAESALTWLKAEACPKCELTGVTLGGRSELPPELGKTIPETKGRQMERAAVQEFLGAAPGSAPDPLAPHDPAEIESFKKLPEREQREKTFELMRRAVITLQRKRVTKEGRAGIPEKDEARKVDCGQDVIDAARGSFGIF